MSCVLPGQGWMVTWQLPDRKSCWTQPIAGWVQSGQMWIPLTLLRHGGAQLGLPGTPRLVVWHPDAVDEYGDHPTHESAVAYLAAREREEAPAECGPPVETAPTGDLL